jgi:predicted lipid-binding transport protein (Tim44 family)
LYPRGAFQWCPSLADAPQPGRDWADQASAIALQFVDAYEANDAATLAKLTDPSVPSDAVWPISISSGSTPTVTGTNARGGDLVNFGCGNDVDAYTVAITLDDGTGSASLDFTLYLMLRSDGWKVWGAY